MSRESLYLNVTGLACLCVAYPMAKCAEYIDRMPGAIWPYVRYDLCKFMVDRVGCIVLLLLLSPIMALIALAVIIESPGGPLFRQDRYGKNRRIFSILKFRTMRHDAEDGILASECDPRVTKVGRILRTFSLDELPQLWNVIRGDMSIIGPRPHVPWATAGGMRYCEADPRYFDRYQFVKPGITGLAQIKGFRGPTNTVSALSNRIRYDLEYIRRRSAWLDLKILFRTVRALSRNAV